MSVNLLWVIGIVGIYRTLIYAIGDPHSEYNPKSVLARYSALICYLRMRQLKIADEPTYQVDDNKEQEIINKEMAMSYVVNRIQPVAGWGYAVGLCSTCTSVWFMLFFVAIPTGSIAWYGVSLLISKIVFKWL